MDEIFSNGSSVYVFEIWMGMRKLKISFCLAEHSMCSSTKRKNVMIVPDDNNDDDADDS